MVEALAHGVLIPAWGFFAYSILLAVMSLSLGVQIGKK